MGDSSLVGEIGDLISGIITPAAKTAATASTGTMLGNSIGNLVGSAEQVLAPYEEGQAKSFNALQTATKQATEADAYDFKATQDVYNSNVALANADYEQQKQIADDFTATQNSYRAVGKQAAIQGAGGADVNEGSNVDVRVDAAQTAKLNSLLGDFESDQRIKAYQMKSDQALAQEAQDQKSSAQARKNSSAYKGQADKANTLSILGAAQKSGNLIKTAGDILGLL